MHYNTPDLFLNNKRKGGAVPKYENKPQTNNSLLNRVTEEIRAGSLEELAKGAQGTVYRYHDKQKSKDYIVKEFNSGTFGNNAYAQEKAATHVLNEDRGSGYDEESHTGIIIMDYFEGKSLNGLQDETPTPSARLKDWTLEQKYNFALKMTEQLDAMHKKNVLHMDLKPENILKHNRKDEFKIIDYGTAEICNGDALSIKSSTASPQYQAPEVCFSMVGKKSDLYALAKILSDDFNFSTKTTRKILGHDTFSKEFIDLFEETRMFTAGDFTRFKQAVEKNPPFTHYLEQNGISFNQGELAPSPIKKENIVTHITTLVENYNNMLETRQLLEMNTPIQITETGPSITEAVEFYNGFNDYLSQKIPRRATSQLSLSERNNLFNDYKAFTKAQRRKTKLTPHMHLLKCTNHTEQEHKAFKQFINPYHKYLNLPRFSFSKAAIEKAWPQFEKFRASPHKAVEDFIIENNSSDRNTDSRKGPTTLDEAHQNYHQRRCRETIPSLSHEKAKEIIAHMIKKYRRIPTHYSPEEEYDDYQSFTQHSSNNSHKNKTFAERYTLYQMELVHCNIFPSHEEFTATTNQTISRDEYLKEVQEKCLSLTQFKRIYNQKVYKFKNKSSRQNTMEFISFYKTMVEKYRKNIDTDLIMKHKQFISIFDSMEIRDFVIDEYNSRPSLKEFQNELKTKLNELNDKFKKASALIHKLDLLKTPLTPSNEQPLLEEKYDDILKKLKKQKYASGAKPRWSNRHDNWHRELRKTYIEKEEKVSAKDKVNNILRYVLLKGIVKNLIKRQVQFTPEILLEKCNDMRTEELSDIHEKLTAPSSQRKSREHIFTSRFFSLDTIKTQPSDLPKEIKELLKPEDESPKPKLK
jgi:serine/threonine protein kinase